jgi:hypothetical protein
MKLKFSDILMIVGIILMIGVTFFIINYSNSQGFSCIQSPVSYYQLKANTSCWCLNGFNQIKIPLT